jgi:uncharacterized protein
MATLPKLANVEIRHTGTPKGRGVFALQAFQPGDVVEICPVIVFECPYHDLPAELQEYVFNWSDLDSSAGKNMQAIAMGYGGMYNCDNPANMRYEAVTEGAQLLQRFVADRQINAGDELTVNYSGKRGAAVSEGNRWFEGRDIVPIFTVQPSGLGSDPRAPGTNAFSLPSPPLE